MTDPKFTQEQIYFLADLIINKLFLPLHVLGSAIEDGKINKKYLEEAYEQLIHLVKWIRKTGG